MIRHLNTCTTLLLISAPCTSEIDREWSTGLAQVLGYNPHVLNVLDIQMRSRLHMQSSHVPHTAWLINKQINHMAK